MTVDKPHNGGTWTTARKKAFIISTLRRATTKWGPKQQVIRNARIRRGIYVCEKCKQETPASLPPLEGNKRRRKGIIADHISPIVSPTDGFIDYNTWIDRCFIEIDGFQALCWQCDQEKQTIERAIRKENK